MSTVADYIDRKADVTAFQGVTASGESLLVMALSQPGEGGRATVGINKLAQRFMLALLNEKGSVTHFQNRGSTFLREVYAGLVRSPADLFAAFSRALLDVSRQLVQAERDDDPDDERYGSAEITGVSFGDGRASVSVKVSSLAESAEIILPIEVSLR